MKTGAKPIVPSPSVELMVTDSFLVPLIGITFGDDVMLPHAQTEDQRSVVS